MTPAWRLIGHEDAETSFLAAARAGSLHHAWLIEGPKGIGKARLAHRLAAFLLGAKGTPFGAPQDDPVMRALIAGSHPDFKRLERELNDKGKLKQDISVDQVRELLNFFNLKPAMGGWRIGIIDSLDELNKHGANALLKTLEEPPPHAALFVLHHGTLPLLPTIRSRCRTLKLSALNQADTEAVLEAEGAPREAADFARGRPGLGLRLATEAGLKSAFATRTLLRGLSNPKESAIIAALQAAIADDSAFEAFREEWLNGLSEKAVAAGPDAAKLARIWLESARLFGEGEDLNMDRAQIVAKVISGLYALAPEA
jgi:DNA polymerase III subunit delta'